MMALELESSNLRRALSVLGKELMLGIDEMQVALIVPFMRLGEVVLREKHLPLSPVSLKDIIFNHPGACSFNLSGMQVRTGGTPSSTCSRLWNGVSIIRAVWHDLSVFA